MLNHLETRQHQWGGRSEAIDNWLQARQQLLILYCQLAGDKAHRQQLPDDETISEFCAALMDYLSAGHFEIFALLVADDAAGLKLKHTLDPHLARTTDAALAFNDTYAVESATAHSDRFDQRLADLGEVLEERFALEDRLIHHMFAQHGAAQIQQVHQRHTTHS